MEYTDITERVVNAFTKPPTVDEDMINRVAFSVLAKARPTDEFAGAFFDIREKAKKMKSDLSTQAQKDLSATLLKDLGVKTLGVTKTDGVPDFKLSLGQYRGSKFVTSAKFTVKLKSEKAANDLLTYLQTRYSPKYKLKGMEKTKDGIVAKFNIR